MATLTRRRRNPVSYEQTITARDLVGWRWKLKLDFDRLDDDQAKTLCDLIEKATIRNGIDLSKLSKSERSKLERLIAVGAGLPPDHFETERKEAEVLREFQKLAADSQRRLTLSRQSEVDFFRRLHESLKTGHMWAGHVALLVVVLSQLQAGEALGHNQEIEGSGDGATLVIDHTWGLFPGGDGGEGVFADWKFYLGWLQETGWLTVAKAGPIWRIGLGEATLKALNHEGSRP